MIFTLVAMFALPGPALAQAPRALTARTRLDTILPRGAVHQYSLRLGAGHSIEITVIQRGVDVVVEVRNERDSVVLSVDSPNGRNGPEIVDLTSTRAARYRVHVRPFDTTEPEGRYTLDVTAWRDPAATRELLAARKRARDAAAAWLRPRSAPLPRNMDPALVGAGRQAARVLLQVAEFNGGDDIWSRSRDWYMALNLLDALPAAGQTKAVVWSHNAHVAAPTDRATPGRPMGAWLRAALGCGYRALAVTFDQGSFVAQIPNDIENDLAISTLPRAPSESIEGVLRGLHAGGTVAAWPCDAGAGGIPAWLQTPQRMQWVGALFRPGTDPHEAFRPFRLLNDFDGIVFIPAVTADEMPADRPLVPARRR